VTTHDAPGVTAVGVFRHVWLFVPSSGFLDILWQRLGFRKLIYFSSLISLQLSSNEYVGNDDVAGAVKVLRTALWSPLPK